MRRIRNLLVVAALIGAVAPFASAQDEPVDSVVLVDVSGEAGRAREFEAVRSLVLDLVPHIARPGAQVALIPFGEGVHTPIVVRVPHDTAGAAKARAQLRSAIEDLRARDPHRFLYAAIERGLGEMRDFAKQHPQRERRMIVLSYGSRDVPAGEPRSTLAQRIAKHDGPGMAVGRDWKFLYGYVDRADPGLRRVMEERGAGTMMALAAGTKRRWNTLHVDWPVIDLGRDRVGEWKKIVTFEANGPVGTVLRLRTGVGPESKGATITVTPAQVRLKTTRQKFRVELSGFAREGANYHGAWIRADAQGARPIWCTGSRAPLLSGASRALVKFEDSMVDFKRVDRGTKATRAFDLIANDEARQRRSELEFEIRDVPADVSLEVKPEKVRLDQIKQVKLVLSAYGKATPGIFESRIVLKPSKGLRTERREILVRYEVGRGGIRAVQTRIQAPDLVRGGEVVAKLTLVPDDGAVEAGAQVRVKVGKLPPGLEVDPPRRFALHEETDLEIRLRAAPGTPNGILRTELHLSSFGAIRVVPSVIPIVVRIVPPPPVTFDRSIDLGRLYATEAGEVIALVPATISRVHHGTLLEFVSPSKQFKVAPSRIRLKEGQQTLRLNVTPDTVGAGPTTATFRVYSLRAGERRREGEFSVAWTVMESFVRVTGWRAPPPLTLNGNLVTAKLEIESSADLKGEDVSLVTNFGSLPAGARFAAGLDSVRLQGGPQTVTIPIDIVKAIPGKFPGSIQLDVPDPVVNTADLRPLPFTIDIPEPPIATELLDPAKQRKMIYLGGVLVLVFLAFAVLFRRLHSRNRRRVEFPAAAPKEHELHGLDERQEYEVHTHFADEEF